MLAMLYDLKDFSIYTSLYCALTVYFVPYWSGCFYALGLLCTCSKEARNGTGNKGKIKTQSFTVMGSINVFMMMEVPNKTVYEL